MRIPTLRTLSSTALVVSLFATSNAQESYTSSSANTITPEMGLFAGGDPNMEGKRVGSVNVRLKSGKTVDINRLRNMVSLKPGDIYSSEEVDKDTKSLYESGLVSNVNVVTTIHGSSISVVYEVHAQPLLAGVGFTGNNNYDEKKLRELTKLTVGKTVSDQDIRSALVELRKFYSDENYPDVKITHSYRPSARQGYVDLYFDIVEGGELMIRNIVFPGNTAFDDSKLKNELLSKEKGIFSFLTSSGKIDPMMLDEDEQTILNMYRDNGYMRAQVGVARLVPVKDKRVDLYFDINEGPKYKIRSVYFGKTTVYKPEELMPGLSMIGGDTYSSKKVSDDITMIRRYYGAKGYADANVRAELKEVGDNMIDIEYTVFEGDPSKVGSISIQGNVKTKDHVIRRELPLAPEDEFNSVELEVAQKRLKNLNYFDPVAVTPAPSTRPGYRDINIEVREKQTGSLSFGLGFSTIESVVFFANVTQSNFDLYDWSSFTGGGQRFSVDARLGDKTQNASISWVEPWFLNRKLALGVDLFYARSEYYSDYYTQQNVGTAISLRQPITDNSYIRYEYKVEYINIDPKSAAPAFFQLQEGDYLRSAINMSYVYDTRDSILVPRKGGKFGIDAGFNGLGGDVKTYTFGLSGSKYWNLKWDTIFSINGAMATVDCWEKSSTGRALESGGYGDFSPDVPIFDRMYLGGPQNLRGFKYRNVGPYDTQYSYDETMGGKSSVFVQFEYTIPIVEEVRFAVFYDIGAVNSDSFDFDLSDYASDWGIGLRLNLPFGPIAVDYAWPIRSGKNAIDEGGQFQFYMNYKF